MRDDRRILRFHVAFSNRDKCMMRVGLMVLINSDGVAVNVKVGGEELR